MNQVLKLSLIFSVIVFTQLRVISSTDSNQSRGDSLAAVPTANTERTQTVLSNNNQSISTTEVIITESPPIDEVRVPKRNKHPLFIKITSWATAIKRYIRTIDCENEKFTTLGRCETIKLIPFKFMRFYTAPPRRNVVYSVVLPRLQLHDSRSHYSVAVVDPFPRASYGHLVFVFYIDGATPLWCQINGGTFLGSGLCLHHAELSQCELKFKHITNQNNLVRNCEVSFIPMVYNTLDENIDKAQMLQCIPKVAGFGNCLNNTNVVKSVVKKNCEILENDNSCYTAKSKQSDRVEPCQLYKTCDNAVAIFGGWNQITNRVKHHKNIRVMFSMLRRNGFNKENIQVFYNGNGDIELGESYTHGLPASSKGSIRRHIDVLCSSPLCSDVLVIYLNGPTSNDGDLLLWDKNGDGEADDSEMYAMNEILHDVAACSAKLVYIFADQSHAGLLAAALEQRQRAQPELYANIALISSSDPTEYAWEREATSHWGSLSHLRSISWTVDGMGFIRSRSTIVNQQLADNFTIYGAPVSRGIPPHMGNFGLLKQKYMGCQVFPSPRWRFRFLRGREN